MIDVELTRVKLCSYILTQKRLHFINHYSMYLQINIPNLSLIVGNTNNIFAKYKYLKRLY